MNYEGDSGGYPAQPIPATKTELNDLDHRLSMVAEESILADLEITATLTARIEELESLVKKLGSRLRKLEIWDPNNRF